MAKRSSVLRAVLVLIGAAAVGLFPTAPARAQTFDEAIRRALDNNCEGLTQAPTPSPPGQYGSNLGALCAASGSPSSTAGGSIASQGSAGAGAEARRLLLRLEEKRQDANLGGGIRAASADQSLQRGRLGVFLTTEFEWINKDQTSHEPGFDSSSKGFIGGADYAIFPWLTVGTAVHYSYVNGNFDSDGGSFNTQAYGFTLYGSFTPMPNFFVDATVGYIHREYDISRRAVYTSPGGTVSGFADGNTTGNEFNMSALAGYDFHVGALTIGPRGGFEYSTNTIEGYGENPRATQSPTGLELAYDDQHRHSLTTKLGFFASYAVGLGFGVLVPQISAHWVHEFLNDQRVIYFRFREDTQNARLRFQTDKPDRDYFHVGAGLVLVLPKDVSAFVSYRVLLGYDDRIAHTLDAGVRIQF